MNISTNIVKTFVRNPLTTRYTEDTRELFLRAEDVVSDENLNPHEFWHLETRKQPMTTIRHALMYVLRDEYGWTFSDIARLFKLHYSTSLYAVTKVRGGLSVNDYSINRYVNQLSKYYQQHGEYTQASKTKYIPCTCRTAQRS